MVKGLPFLEHILKTVYRYLMFIKLLFQVHLCALKVQSEIEDMSGEIDYRYGQCSQAEFKVVVPCQNIIWKWV